MTSSNPSLVVRQGTVADVERILDLLTEYDLPRSYFEPYYLDDPTYQPHQSWLLEVDGRLAAHVRVFDRSIRVSGAILRVAGIGNVITANSARGRGFVGQLLRATLVGLTRQEYAYSLLWTHLPGLYARYGWTTVEQQAVQATLPDLGAPVIKIEPFRMVDLPEIETLYVETNHERTGTTVRDTAYWRGQLAWLRESPDLFLVARRDARLVGYVRGQATHTEVEILELGLAPAEEEVGRALLPRMAASRGGRLRAVLPPSLLHVLPADSRDLQDQPGLMGRAVHLDRLVQTMLPIWRQRALAARLRDTHLRLSTAAGAVELTFNEARVRAVPLPANAEGCLDEGELAHLLFHGFDAAAADLLGDRPNAACLRTLFPEQDFVIWPADAF
jgi:predicted acetyltransferase